MPTSPARRGRPRHWTPPVISDWAALDRRIEEFISSGSLASTTQRNHDRYWARWVAHCADLGVDPLHAPYDAYTALLTLTRQDGRPYTAGTIDCYLAAVRHRYGDTPCAIDLPENSGDWRSLMRGLRRKDGTTKQRRRAAGEPTTDVHPLLREDLRQMLAAEPELTPGQTARKAAVLASFDGLLTPQQLADLTAKQVEQREGGVSVDGLVIECDHRERVPGVPWDCTACAVHALAIVVGEGPLLAPACTFKRPPATEKAARQARLAAVTQVLAKLRDKEWGGADTDKTPIWHVTRFVAAEGQSDYQVAGLRRAGVLAASTGKSRGTVTRARAWTALAWSMGLRMCSDMLDLERHALHMTHDGITLALAGTKDDPTGAKDIHRLLPHSDALAAGRVADYVCVRDAVHGTTGPLLVPDLLTPHADRVHGIHEGARGARGATVAKADLAALCDLAGLEAKFSAYSVRKGFSVQAKKDGWPDERIASALRHKSLATTSEHYELQRTARDVVKDLQRRMEGREAA